MVTITLDKLNSINIMEKDFVHQNNSEFMMVIGKMEYGKGMDNIQIQITISIRAIFVIIKDTVKGNNFMLMVKDMKETTNTILKGVMVNIII